MQKLMPGVYVDADGTMHIDAVEMCVANGYEPTPENQAALEAAARDVADGVVDVVEHGKDQRCR